jgi:hypothetical protein
MDRQGVGLAQQFLELSASQALKLGLVAVSCEHSTTRQFPCSKYFERARATSLANWAQRRGQTASKRNQVDPA